MGFLSSLFGSDDPAPTYQSYSQPGQEDLTRLINQLLISGYQNPQTLQLPEEYLQAGGIYGQIANQPFQQFQFPLEDIRSALDAQQNQSIQDYSKYINPILARQGALDSTYAANLYSDYINRLGTGRLGTEADILTQQALQNLQARQVYDQSRLQGAGGLENVGAARGNINQFNQTFPYQYQIPAGQNQLGYLQGQQQNTYNAALSEFNRRQEQQSRIGGSLGGLFGAGAGLLLSGGNPAGAQLGYQFGDQLGSGGQQGFDLNGIDLGSLYSKFFPQQISRQSQLGSNLKRLARRDQLYPGAVQQSRQYANAFPGFFN